jgi:hypothetical protein
VQNANVLSINLPANHTVQWYLNGNEIVGANNANLTISTNGDYTATVSNAGGCNSSDTGSFSVVTSLNENDINNDFRLFPNPTKDIISISSKLLNDKTIIKIYNSLGSEVLVQEYQNVGSKGVLNIDLSDQAAGLYFVNLVNGSTTITKKLLVKR